MAIVDSVCKIQQPWNPALEKHASAPATQSREWQVPLETARSFSNRICLPSSTSTSPRLQLRRPTGANFLSRHQLASLSPEPHTSYEVLATRHCEEFVVTVVAGSVYFLMEEKSCLTAGEVEALCGGASAHST